jgi:hypothetical protein
MLRTLGERVAQLSAIAGSRARPRHGCALERRLQAGASVGPRRILLLHDSHAVLETVWRICHRHHAALQMVRSQSELLELLSVRSSPSDLVIAKDVGPDWFTVAATLLACRAFGVRTPFLVVAEPSDTWTKQAVETAGSAVLIDDRADRWLVPLLVADWLDGLRRDGRQDAGAFCSKNTSTTPASTSTKPATLVNVKGSLKDMVA